MQKRDKPVERTNHLKPSNLFNNFVIVLIIIFFGFLCYFNTLNHPFVWDDYHLVTNNTFIRSWGNIPEIFKTQLFYGGEAQSNSYRPFQSLTLMLDYSIWGLNPIGYHLTNIILHILAALLLYFLLLRMTSDQLISYFTSLLFITHPINTEAVAYISGRADSLSAIFILASILLWIRSKSNKTLYLMSIISFIFALLSMESAIVLLLLLLAYEFIFNQTKKNKFIALIPFFAIILLYAVLRLTILNFKELRPVDLTLPLAGRLLTTVKAIFLYYWMLFLPINLHMERAITISKSIFEPYTLTAIIGLILILIGSIKIYKRSKILFFAITWFFINIIPYSNIIPLNALVAEHWLYLASIGFLLFPVYLTFNTLNLRKAGTYFFSIVIILYSALTFNQNKVWKDELTLYTSILKFNPYSVRAHFMLGKTYNKLNRDGDAMRELQTVIKLKPSYVNAYNDLGVIYLNRKEYNLAMQQFQKAIDLWPSYELSYYNLGRVYETLGDFDKAKAEYAKSLNINPKSAKTYANLGGLCQQLQDNNKAIEHYKAALALNPYLPEIYINLGAIYGQASDYKRAIEMYMVGLKLNPNSAILHYNLGLAYKKEGRYNDAIEEYQAAIRLAPNYAEAYGNLGVAYAKQGMIEEAKKAIAKSIEIDPNNEVMKQNLEKLNKK